MIRRAAAPLLALALPVVAAQPIAKPQATPAPAPALSLAPAVPASPAAPVPTEKPPELSPEEAARKQLINDSYRRACELAKGGDFDGAFRVVQDFAARAGASDPYYHELRGTVLALKKDYPAAQKAFEQMLAVTPNSHIGRFNRAEMIFLQGHYEEAEKEFAAIEETVGPRDPAVADLCRYKRVLAFLAMGKTSAADLLVPPLREGNESPALSYSRAAQAYVAKNIVKAVQLLEDARVRFPEGVDTLYTDSLVELHWGQRDPQGHFIFKPLPRVR
jgi:predicted Zn-dependent protease